MLLNSMHCKTCCQKYNKTKIWYWVENKIVSFLSICLRPNLLVILYGFLQSQPVHENRLDRIVQRQHVGRRAQKLSLLTNRFESIRVAVSAAVIVIVVELFDGRCVSGLNKEGVNGGPDLSQQTTTSAIVSACSRMRLHCECAAFLFGLSHCAR